MGHEPPTNEIAAFRARLEAQKAAIEEMLAALDRYASVGVAVGIPTSERAVDPLNIPNDAFFGMSIGEAAKKLLGIVRRKQSVREIAEALDRGGLQHASEDFVNTVSTMLRRHAARDADLVRVGRSEWGLAQWYGNRRAAKVNPGRSPKSRPAGRVRRATPDVAVVVPSSTQLAQRVIWENGSPMTVDSILTAIHEKFGRDVKKDTLVGNLSRAVARGDSFYRAGPSLYGLLEQKGK